MLGNYRRWNSMSRSIKSVCKCDLNNHKYAISANVMNRQMWKLKS